MIAWKKMVRWVLWGAAAGTLVGVIGGGLTSAVYGQPFVGVTGQRGLVGGLVFPGLLMVAPVTAQIGAATGFAIVAIRHFVRRRQSLHLPEDG
jgi:hypothetical protein